MKSIRKGLNKREIYMGEFETKLELLATSKGTWITDCNLDDTVYIPNGKFDEFIKELISIKESYSE